MTEVERVVLTSGLTIVGGLIVLVLGQLVSKFVIEPLHDFRTLLGEIAFAILYYRNASDIPVLRPAATGSEAMQALRGLAGKLWQRAYAIPRPVYWTLSHLGVLPSWDDIANASQGLVGFSNNVASTSSPVDANVRAIAQALRLPKRD